MVLAQVQGPVQVPAAVVRDLEVVPIVVKGPTALERRRALVIGNDRYPTAALSNATNDARSIADVLIETGFETMLVENATLQDLEQSVGRFVERVQQNDVAVVFYAGHGFQIDGENYLVPIDFKSDDPSAARFTSFPAGRLFDSLAARGPKLQIVILDACRNNPFKVSRSASGGLAMMGTGGKGTFIALSTAPGSTASDNPNGSNGLFTSALLKVIHKKAVGLTEMFDEVKREVSLASNDAQRPWTNTDFGGKWYFRPPDDYVPEEIDPATSFRILEQARVLEGQAFLDDAAKSYDQLDAREKESELGKLARTEATFLRALQKVKPDVETVPAAAALESVWELIPARAALGLEVASAYLVAGDAAKGIQILSRLRGADKDVSFRSTEMLQALSKAYPAALQVLGTKYTELPADPLTMKPHSRFEGMAEKLLAEVAKKRSGADADVLPPGVKTALPPPTIQGLLVRLETIPVEVAQLAAAVTEAAAAKAANALAVAFVTVPAGATITIVETPTTTCTSPCSLDLAPGERTVDVAMAGYRGINQKVMVSATAASFNFELVQKSGVVAFETANEQAAIELDGKILVERTPSKLTVPAGDYLLSFWDGKIRIRQQKITILDNETVRLTLRSKL